ncbi:MAG: AAA domain-containing protein [Bacteroidia bacterium]|nr:AAA domain-containing protein [Bacteroidia bacterium]
MLSFQRKQNHKAASDTATPLVNLFAYIRDLFTTVKGGLRFDEDKNQWWALEDLLNITTDKAVIDREQFHFQWKNAEKPLLILKRGEADEMADAPKELRDWIEVVEEGGKAVQLIKKESKHSKFEEVASRMKAFREFKKQVDGKSLEEVSTLTLPPALNPWISLSQEDGKIYVNKVEEAEEKFGDDELRKEMFASYERNFNKHHQGQANFLQINNIYDALHDLYFQMQTSQDRQLTLSFGLVSGKIGGKEYHNFLFHLPLTLSLEKQELILEADTFAHVITCEQNFTELLEAHFQGEDSEKTHKRKLKVLQEVDNFNRDSRELNFEADYLRGSFYASAIRILEVFPKIEDLFFQGKELNYCMPAGKISEEIRFSFSPVIQTRMLNTGAHVARDAERIISSINELGGKDQNDQIPDFFKKLFSLRKPGNPLRIAYKSMAKDMEAPRIVEDLPERFLFPLAYNAEQLNIAKQLLRQDAVTVQGPPGTGKSHTIANLTSHFVAEGKSILIVSKNAKALEVIREKLPQEIRNLMVAFLKGNEHQEMLRSSIDAVKDNLSRKYEEGEILKMENDLKGLEEQFESTLSEVKSRISSQHEDLSLWDPFMKQERKASAIEWIEELARLGEVQYIKDEIYPSQESGDWAAKLIQVLDFIQESGRPEGEQIFPEEEVLPRRERLEKIFAELAEWENLYDIRMYSRIKADALNDDLLERLKEAKTIHTALCSYESLLLHPAFQLRKLKQVLDQCRPIFHYMLEEEKALLRYQIEWEDLTDLDPDLGLKEIRNLFEKYGDSGKLNILKKKFLNETQKAFYLCKVNGLEVKGLEQLLVLERSLTQAARIKQLQILMNNFGRGVGIEVEKDQVESSFEHWDSLEVSLKKFEDFNLMLRSIGAEILSKESTERPAQIEFLTSLSAYKGYEETRREWEEISLGLQEHKELHKAIKERELVLFDQEIQELKEAKAWEAENLRHAALLEELRELLPQTFEYLSQTEELELSEVQLNREILALKIQKVLQGSLEALGNPRELIEALKNIQKDIQKKVVELIAYKTWYHKQIQISDEQKSALTAWRNDLVNIGKGHGKNAEKNMKSAVSNMRLAREVVPVWVMQQDTAINFFQDPNPGQFDVLIVDEASQCDISMLNLIYRSKKCIIVGDENQTAVATQARLFPLSRTNQLLDRYLINHPFKQQFNINNRSSSVYSLSGVIYPNIISLREHFRCRPELIGFSNKYVYDKQIIPLKTSTDNLYGAAAEVHYIEDDPKNPKKPAIVKACVQLIGGLIEDVEAGRLPNLPTLGILCLDSSNEEHRDLLNKEFNRHPLIKAHREELKLLVGTSREFQGDERDIMILTTTASHSFTAEGKIRAPRSVMGEDMSRIYNVASSRAREKAILLHSIHPEALAKMKPECFRKRIIDYFSIQMMENEKEEKVYQASDMHASLGEMGRMVFEKLAEEGFGEHLVPQYKLGPYEVDLALIKDGKKKAIFLDLMKGSADNLDKQLVLERAGWDCYRLQPLEWVLSEEGAMEKLSQWVKS